MEPNPQIDWSGRRLGGRYLIGRCLGTGGMGAVYQATQEDLGRRVAIKLLHPFLAERADLLARFRREAMAAAALGHANIVQVTDFRQEPGEPAFLVMELLEGHTLKQAIGHDGTLSAQRVAYIAAQVLSALEAAHHAGIVHRDLKPENIFLTSISGVRDVVKVLDFGLAKHNQSEATTLTASGALLGTPAYMAPEQISGDAVTPATDIYGLGATMYHALTGQLPFRGDNQYALIYAIMETRPPTLASLRADLDPGLVAVVERAMARDPAVRFASAREMRHALRPFAGAMADFDSQSPTLVPDRPAAPGTSRGQTVVPGESPDAHPTDHVLPTQPSYAVHGATASPQLAPPPAGVAWSPAPAPAAGVAPIPIPVPVPVPMSAPAPAPTPASAGAAPPPSPMAARPLPPPMPGAYRPAMPAEGPSGLLILGKIFGYGMLAFGAFWLFIVPLVLIDGDDDASSAAMGGLLMGFLCGVPGGLVTYFVRKADRHAKVRNQLMGFIQSHDAFSAADLAPKIGEPEFETEQLIVTLVHEHRLPLLFHARDRRYYHPDRLQRSYAVLTHCQSCGARMGSEIIFAGETRRCHYCGAPVQPQGGWAG